jgi:hypothetical protein
MHSDFPSKNSQKQPKRHFTLKVVAISSSNPIAKLKKSTIQQHLGPAPRGDEKAASY